MRNIIVAICTIAIISGLFGCTALASGPPDETHDSIEIISDNANTHNNTGPPGSILSDTLITKEYVYSIAQLKDTDIAEYCRILEAMSDEEYAMFASYLPAILQETESLKYNVPEPVDEAMGTDYILQTYDININEIGIDGLVLLLYDLEIRDPDKYFDIVGNLTDEQYDEYFKLSEYYAANNLYRKISSITPFLHDNTLLKSGTAILKESDNGKLKIPENVIFLVSYSDGTEKYVYCYENTVGYLRINEGIRVIYTDEEGLMGECLLTKPQPVVYSENNAQGFLYQVPGNLTISELNDKISNAELIITDAKDNRQEGNENLEKAE